MAARQTERESFFYFGVIVAAKSHTSNRVFSYYILIIFSYYILIIFFLFLLYSYYIIYSFYSYYILNIFFFFYVIYFKKKF